MLIMLSVRVLLRVSSKSISHFVEDAGPDANLVGAGQLQPVVEIERVNKTSRPGYVNSSSS